MRESSNPIVSLPAVGAQDVLTSILRDGAQRLLTHAIEAEVAEWIDQHRHVQDERGHRQIVRNGHLPERTQVTGVGPVKVQQPRVLDRRPADEAEPFSSKILPPYLRKTKSREELIPWLYLTKDVGEACLEFQDKVPRDLRASGWNATKYDIFAMPKAKTAGRNAPVCRENAALLQRAKFKLTTTECRQICLSKAWAYTGGEYQ